MTRWAFFGDVHGNWPALARAERLAEARDADRFVGLGDWPGRGQPAARVAWLRAHATLAVVGNRDRDHLALVDANAQAYPRALPVEAAAEDFPVTHGDARLTRALASADERRAFRHAYAALTAAGKMLWLFGHTHRAPPRWLSEDGGAGGGVLPGRPFAAPAIRVDRHRGAGGQNQPPPGRLYWAIGQ